MYFEVLYQLNIYSLHLILLFYLNSDLPYFLTGQDETEGGREYGQEGRESTEAQVKEEKGGKGLRKNNEENEKWSRRLNRGRGRGGVVDGEEDEEEEEEEQWRKKMRN